MAQVINTNIASLNAQRNLNSSQGDFNTALQRLSSGLRINSAKDDAAGLAIASRIDAQVRRVDVHFNTFVHLRIHKNRCERGVASATGIKWGFTHEAVHTRFGSDEEER